MESGFIGSSSPYSDRYSTFFVVHHHRHLSRSNSLESHHGCPPYIFTLPSAIRRRRCGSIQHGRRQFIAVRCRKPSHVHFRSSLL